MKGLSAFKLPIFINLKTSQKVEDTRIEPSFRMYGLEDLLVGKLE